MSNNRTIKGWFELAIPAPTDANLHVQLGCHFEEVAEMIDTLAGQNSYSADLLGNALHHIHVLAEELKKGEVKVEVVDELGMLDSICDQNVTAIGVAHMLDMDFISALTNVNDSNWSKFVDGKPIFDDNGKIKKGPSYKEPVLMPFLNSSVA